MVQQGEGCDIDRSKLIAYHPFHQMKMGSGGKGGGRRRW
jgi:hypothetical protein